MNTVDGVVISTELCSANVLPVMFMKLPNLCRIELLTSVEQIILVMDAVLTESIQIHIKESL